MTDYVIASPNGGTWTIQNTDSATVGRYCDLALLMEGASGAGNGFKQCRPGVMVGPSIASPVSNTPGGFAVAASGALTFSIQPGAAVVERSTLVGPYLVESTAVGAAAVGAADPSQTRVDRVDLQVLDGALGDNGGVSKTSVKVTPGTPGAGTPSAPASSIPLGIWTIPATTTTLTGGMWTPTWKSTCLRGGTRVLGPGDALTDPGFVVAEERMRFNATYGWLKDFWDPAANSGAGLWRGTQTLVLARPAQTGSGTLTSGSTATIASVTVADPGWPYHIVSGGMVDFGATNAGDLLQVSINVGSTVFGTNSITRGHTPARSGSLAQDQNVTMATDNSRSQQAAGYTGAQALSLVAKNNSAATMTIYNGPGGNGGDPYQWGIELIPALI